MGVTIAFTTELTQIKNAGSDNCIYTNSTQCVQNQTEELVVYDVRREASEMDLSSVISHIIKNTHFNVHVSSDSFLLPDHASKSVNKNKPIKKNI